MTACDSITAAYQLCLSEQGLSPRSKSSLVMAAVVFTETWVWVVSYQTTGLCSRFMYGLQCSRSRMSYIYLILEICID